MQHLRNEYTLLFMIKIKCVITQMHYVKSRLFEKENSLSFVENCQWNNKA